MSRRSQERRWKQSGVTGADVLLVMSRRVRDEHLADDTMAEAFTEMVMDCFIREGNDDDLGVEIARRPLHVDQATAAAIIMNTVAYAIQEADQETIIEALSTSVALGLKFREYLEVTGKGV